jgi:hypothetical protein
MLGRIVGGAIIAVVGYFLIKKLRKMGDDDEASPSISKQAQGQLKAQSLVTCGKCGVSIPFDEAISKGDQFVCKNPASCQS